MLDVYLDISTENEDEMVKSFVAVDNYTNGDRNIFAEKRSLEQEETFDRLIRRNSDIKQSL